MSLDIRLLGGFELVREGRALDQLSLRAARSLFAYLLLNRERPHTRDLLAGTFWPEFDDSRARRRLSQALWQIRTVLGDTDANQYLIGEADTVRFNPDADFTLDVDQFEAAVAADDIPTAVELYRGDLLAGMYDDWLLSDQNRLRSRFLQVLERLTETETARGDLESALIHARRLAAEDEFSEEAHRRVMRIAVLLGRHNEAIRQFEECRRILADELGAEPSPETVALYEATIADRDTGGRAALPREGSPLFEDTARSPYVGREAERAQFARRLDDALDGRGGVVLIEGEAGVGKTRLLEEVVADAQWRGLDVLWGRSAPSGGRPFGALSEALASVAQLRARQVAGRLDPAWRSVLAPLAPALGGDAPLAEPVLRADEQSRMREALTAAFREMAAIAPTLVVLEDVHWADDDTIHALNQMVGQIGADRLLIAVSYRHGEARERSDVWDLLRTLDRLQHASRISLAPYSPAQSEELIRRSLGLLEVSSEFSERLHRETGGIPLFLVETLRALYERNDLAGAEIDAEEAPASRDRLPLSPAVHSLIKHRLETLEPPSRDTLELVSVHDGTMTLPEIEGASPLDSGTALAAVDDLLRRRFLAGVGTSYSLGHELMRRVVYDGLTLSRKMDLHRRVAASVEAHRPDDVEVLAHHFLNARMPDRASEFLERAAARAIAVHAYDTAALHLERASAALDEISAPDERRFAVASLHEEVLDVLGRRDDQEHAIARMERFGSEAQRPAALTRKAWWQAHQDEFKDAVDTAGEALRLAEADGDPGRIVAALTALGMIACFGGKAAEGVEYLERAADFRGVDRRQEADARNALGQNLIDLQRFGEAESQLLAALAIYGELGDARGQADVLGMLATLRMERGEPESAGKDYERAIALSRRIGYRHGEAVNQMNLGILYVITNQLGDALRMFDAAAETYRSMGNARGRALVQSNAAWLWHGLVGDDEKADSMVRSAIAVYERIDDDRGKAHCAALLGSIAGRRGRLDEATQLFEQATQLTRDAGDAWLSAQALRHYAAFELAWERPESGLSHALEAEALCKEHGMNDLVVAVRALIARLYLKNGDDHQAFEYARRALREIRPGIELAHMVPFSMGEVFESQGKHDEALRQYLHSREILHETLKGLDQEHQAMSLATVEAHRIVEEKWRSQQPEVREVRLPSAAAPTGRPLTDDDHVTVKWTVHDPSDNLVDDRARRRHTRLLRLIDEAQQQSALPTIDQLADAVGASSATVRRDLALLRREGVPVPTRGNR